MEYESYTKAFDKKKEAKICFQTASNGSFNDFSTPIEIFICELQKVKNENQDTMEYEAYTKAFDKKEKA